MTTDQNKLYSTNGPSGMGAAPILDGKKNNIVSMVPIHDKLELTQHLIVITTISKINHFVMLIK